MHISRIKATNFGSASDNEVNLVDGLVVVRASNGAGKSSLFYQAPMYAFFGTSTLDCSLDETVTDGEKPGSLKVEVDYGPWTWKRSKGSASVTGPDINISGQAEVTAFSEQILGVSKDSAELVLVSKQGETAGIVSKKSAAINQFIEEAADFKKLEDIIERAKELYPYGNVDVYEEMINAGVIAVGEVGASIEDLEEEEIIKAASLKNWESRLEEEKAKLPPIQSQIAIFDNSLKLDEQMNKLDDNIKLELIEIGRLQADKAMLVGKEYLLIDTSASESYVGKWPTMQEEWAEYEKFLGMKLEEPFWEGSEESFLADLKEKKQSQQTLRENILDLKYNIKSEKGKISTNTLCLTCGTDLKEKVEPINIKAREAVARLEKELLDKEAELLIVEAEVKALEEIKKKHVVSDFKYICYVKTTVPFGVEWNGGVTTKPDSELYKKHLGLIQSNRDLRKQQEVDWKRIVELEDAINKSTERHASLSSERESLGERFDIESIATMKRGLEESVAAINLIITKIEEGIKSDSTRLTEIATSIKEKKNRLVELDKEMKGLKEKIKIDKDNSLFVKCLRDTKPKVLQKVWGGILAVIETPFREITGRDLEIGRGAKGFTAGGRPTARLSGSEKSILGICFRSALRDLFAPTCGFVIFDEPFGDMDEERTAAGIGALMQMRGMRILITHESTSEMGADQIIEM